MIYARGRSVKEYSKCFFPSTLTKGTKGFVSKD